MKLVTRYAAVLLVFVGSGCSVVQSISHVREAEREIARGEEAVSEGDYEEGLKSYLRARILLQETRDAGLGALADDKKMKFIDKAIRGLAAEAEAEGFVRVDDRYCGGSELGEALGKALGTLFRGSHLRSIPAERVVADDIRADVRRESGNAQDIALSIVVKGTGEDQDFSQDAWAVVRFLLEGAYGHGFSYHVTHPFERRPWMGGEGWWGLSEEPNAENHFIGLKGKVANLSIEVYRGRYRQEADTKYGRYGFESLKAVGPYWEREPFRVYSIGAADAARLHWAEAGRIPDATLYGLLKIVDRSDAAIRETAGATSSPRVE